MSRTIYKNNDKLGRIKENKIKEKYKVGEMTVGQFLHLTTFKKKKKNLRRVKKQKNIITYMVTILVDKLLSNGNLVKSNKKSNIQVRKGSKRKIKSIDFRITYALIPRYKELSERLLIVIQIRKNSNTASSY